MGACFDSPPSVDGEGTAGTAGTAGAEGTAGDETAAKMTVSVSGTVVASWFPPGDTPIEGTLVELLGEPGVSAVTGADGRFTIEGVPAGEVAYFAVAPSTTYLGSVIGVDVPFVDVAELELARFGRLEAEMQVQMLQQMDPSIAYDDTRGAMLVTSSHPETDISITPMPEPDHYYALDMAGTAVLGGTSSTFLVPAVVYFNLDVVEEGTIEVSADHPMRTCDVPLPSPPILAEHVSLVRAICG